MLNDLPVARLLATAATCFLAYFLTKLYNARRFTYRLQKAGMPMPPLHPIFGHLLFVKQVRDGLPADGTIHFIFEKIAKDFPNGYFYIDLWPLSQPLLTAYTPEAARQLVDFELPKMSMVEEGFVTLLGEDTLLSMTPKPWKHWRGLLNPGFSAGYLFGQAHAVAEEANVFRKLLQDQARTGGITQVAQMTLKLAADVIVSVVMDTRLHHQIKDSPLIVTLRQQIDLVRLEKVFRPLGDYFSLRPIKQWYNLRFMNRIIYAAMEDRRAEIQEESAAPGDAAPASGQKSKSVLSLLMRTYLEQEQNSGSYGHTSGAKDGFALDDAFKRTTAATIRMFLFAGTDTTSAAVVYALHHAYRNSDVLARLRAEHDAVFGPDLGAARGAIARNPALLNELPYTGAAVKETLRLHATTSSYTRTAAGPADLVGADGTRYPIGGCHVMLLAPSLHNNPALWPRPDEFLPERWLVGPDDPLYPVKDAYRPFSAGPRSCIGQTLAVMEIKVVLVMTLREFDITPAYDEWDQLHPKKGIKTVEGNRAYHQEGGAGGGHAADWYPCRVTFASRKE